MITMSAPWAEPVKRLEILPYSDILNEIADDTNLKNKPEQSNAEAENSVDCELVSKITGNYVIVRNTLNKLNWQDIETCKMVNKLWREVALTLTTQIVESTNFVLLHKDKNTALLESRCNRTVPPMALLLFCSKFDDRVKCYQFPGGACDPPCQDYHLVLDILEAKYTHPKYCFEAITTSHLIFDPLPRSPTFTHATKTFVRCKSKYYGMILPQIANVKFHSMGCKVIQGGADGLFLSWLHGILDNEIIKGAIFLISSDFDNLEETVEVIGNQIQAAQPEHPMAMAGCFVDGAIIDLEGGSPRDYRMLKVLLFAVNKDKISETDFDIHTLNIPKSALKKNCITNKIKEFESQIANHQYSAAIRFSCVGRNFQHTIESEMYRKYFPKTPVVGCFGTGEMAWEHPSTSDSSPPKRKRQTILSYSTIFMHLGWGPKIN